MSQMILVPITHPLPLTAEMQFDNYLSRVYLSFSKASRLKDHDIVNEIIHHMSMLLYERF